MAIWMPPWRMPSTRSSTWWLKSTPTMISDFYVIPEREELYQNDANRFSAEAGNAGKPLRCVDPSK
jgi:hypothetical protein